MKRILVTGAGGFAGGKVAEYLKSNGYEVTGVVYRTADKRDFPIIRRDLSEPWDITGQYDVIVHAAGCLEYRKPTVLEYKRGNVDVMEHLLEYAQRAGIKRVINFSTIGVYGEFRKTLIGENDDRTNPDYYGLTKYLAECMLKDANEVEGISLRMPGIVGKGSRGVWFPITMEKFRRNEPVTIYSPDFQTKNFVWVEDLARFVAQLIGQERWKYDVVNLACEKSASIKEIVDEMKTCTGSRSEIIVAEGERSPFCLDNSRAMEMGYRSLTPLEIVRAYAASI